MRIRRHAIVTVILAATSAAVPAAPLRAQEAPRSSPTAREPVTATGCVSSKPDASGQYTLADEEGVARYRLSGRRLSRFAGQRVELVAKAPGGLTIRGGLVGPLNGPRGVGADPARDAVRRQPGGGGSGVGPTIPEFQVAQVRAMPGVCEEPAAR